jgi:hypothetical protein
MVNWTKQRDMSPKEYRETIKALGMSQSAAGRFLGLSARTSRRYARGQAEIPAAHVLLLRACKAYQGRFVLYVPKWQRGQN